jgi:hypothetical protein
LNDELPPSANKHQAWWSNETNGVHVSAHAWMDADWKTDIVDFNQKWVNFVHRE